MKILFYGSAGEEKEYLENKIKELNITIDAIFLPEALKAGVIPPASDAEILSVFVDSVVNRETIQGMPNLKCIVTRSTGFDHIDLAAARERNIVVSNVPSYGENTVAEYAFALLLTLSRKVHLAYDRIRETGSFSQQGLEGFDLAGKTLGVLGTGRIGRHAIKMGKGFGMEVVGYDPYPNQELAGSLGFTYVSLDELLAKSDVLTIHIPYMKATHHLLNEAAFGKVKKGAYLINTSRGAVVDTDAMVRALQSGILGGAGLDVLEEEGIVKDELGFLVHGHPNAENLKIALENHILVDLPNVVVTPHNAFNTKEARQRILNTTLHDVAGFIAGTPKNIVEQHE
ncbi:MAG: NAD(P)-dependent oxidoreductase [Patescibacteria group bacterium]